MDEAEVIALSTRWWDEIWRDGRVDVVDEIFADPFVRHVGHGTIGTRRAEYKSMLAEFQRTLFRPTTTIDDRVVDGDKVWTRATSKGTNRATGEPTTLTWMLIQRIADGRIVEHWLVTVRDVNWTE